MPSPNQQGAAQIIRVLLVPLRCNAESTQALYVTSSVIGAYITCQCVTSEDAIWSALASIKFRTPWTSKNLSMTSSVKDQRDWKGRASERYCAYRGPMKSIGTIKDDFADTANASQERSIGSPSKRAVDAMVCPCST